MNEVLERAEINKKPNGLFYVILVAAFLSIVLFIVSMVPVKRVDRSDLLGSWRVSHGGYYDEVNIFGEIIRWNRSGRDKVTGEWEREADTYGILERGSSTIGLLGIILLVPLAFSLVIIHSNATGCSLVLTDNTVEGKLKTLSGSKEMKLPFDEISSISIGSGFIDKALSGKTVRIATSSGIIKFCCISNAEVFVSSSLEKIEECKKQAQENRTATQAIIQNTVPQSEANKIVELKGLLDSGLISQEEFDQKKQELLSKM